MRGPSLSGPPDSASRCAGRRPRAGVPAPGVHRQPAAEDPGKGEQAEHEAGVVVPPHQAGVGRVRAAVAQPVGGRGRHPPQPPDDARQGQHAAEHRQPDHQVGPEGCPRAQGREVQPVGHRPQPCPEPAPAGGLEDRLDGAVGDVEDRRGVVAEGHAMEGKEGAALQRPLIGRGQPRVVAGAGCVPGRKAPRDLHGLLRPQPARRLARVGVDRRPAAAPGEPIDGPVAVHADENARRRETRPHRRLAHVEPGRRQVEDGRARKPLGGVEGRHARVHEDDAGGEPDDEEHAAGDAQPAMGIDEAPAQDDGWARHRSAPRFQPDGDAATSRSAAPPSRSPRPGGARHRRATEPTAAPPAIRGPCNVTARPLR